MTITTSVHNHRRGAMHPTVVRALGIVGATAAALAVWTVSVPLLGTQLFIRFGNSAPQPVGITAVVSAVVVGSLAGWGVLAVMEHRVKRARSIWTVVALGALLASIAMPLYAAMSGSAAMTLVAMHLAVGAVVIPVFRTNRPSASQAR